MGNQQKTPLARTMNAWVRDRAQGEIGKLGLAYPGTVISVTGAIITANLEVMGETLPQVTCPLAYPVYIRLPIQAGDKGIAVPASVLLSGVSGLAPATASGEVLEGNLSTLYWLPIGSKNFSSWPANILGLIGPAGVTLQTTDGAGSIQITESSITLTAGGKSIVIASTGITIDGKQWELHEHHAGTFVAGSTAVTGNSGTLV